MARPHAPQIVLEDEAQQVLESLVRAHSTPQALVVRCQLILRVAEDQPTNETVASEWQCSRDTVAKWRRRYQEQGISGLMDAPRSGRPRRFSPLGTVASRQRGVQRHR